jgi:hypothetical protein
MRSDANRRPIAGQSHGSTDAATRPSSPTGKARPHALPEDWQLSDAARQFATEHGVKADGVLAELRDWAATKDHRSWDWEAEFRRFVRQASVRRRQAPLPPMGMPQGTPTATRIAEADRPLAARLDRLWTAWSRDKAPPMPVSLETFKTGLAAAEPSATRWLDALEAWDGAGRPSRIRVPDFERTISGRDDGALADAEREIAAIAQQRRA